MKKTSKLASGARLTGPTVPAVSVIWIDLGDVRPAPKFVDFRSLARVFAICGPSSVQLSLNRVLVTLPTRTVCAPTVAHAASATTATAALIMFVMASPLCTRIPTASAATHRVRATRIVSHAADAKLQFRPFGGAPRGGSL